MATFFANFPKLIYGKTLITDILVRLGIDKQYKSKDELYVLYPLKDGDTPDNIAARYYGDSNKHWIILLANDMLDPRFDFPLTEYQFIKFLDKKYKDYDPDLTGSRYARITLNPNPFTYRLTTTITDYSTNEYLYDGYSPTIETIFIDEETASNTSLTMIETQEFKIEKSLSTLNIYDWEYELNEKKRYIKLLKKELASSIENELRKVYT